MRLTFLSDTHNKHKQVTSSLNGGDVLIHAGDISSMGYEHEINDFCKWFSSLDNYTHKIFIAGNHDWGFQTSTNMVKEVLSKYPNITYLQDETITIDGVNIYGSPWQPYFHNWAFNLPRNGEELKSKWDNIPETTHILITHGPARGFLDDVQGRRGIHLGCELLTERIKVVKPKFMVCGHIHSGWGYRLHEGTHYVNASVLNEQYIYSQTPWDFDWDPETNEVK